MKKLVLMLLLGAAVVFTPAVAAADNISVSDVVVLSDVAGDSNGSAGGSSGGTWWVNVNSGQDLFKSFCIELSETLSLGSSFYVNSIEAYAVGGGADSDIPLDGMDFLSANTQNLYDYFRSTAQVWEGWEFQQAFWYFEEEIGGYTAGNRAVAWALANQGYQRNGVVQALNLNYHGEGFVGENAQSLLTWQRTTVPDGGMTLMLLGGALMGLGALRRKIR